MSDAPERIKLYSIDGCYCEIAQGDEPDQVEYVRADRIEALVAENKRLRVSAVKIRSAAILDFCRMAKIPDSVQAEHIPDDVREERRRSAHHQIAEARAAIKRQNPVTRAALREKDPDA